MAVMDEFKEEREALKDAGFKKKFRYFLDYYKWYVIISVLAVILVGTFIYEIVTQRENMFYAVHLNSVARESSEEFTQKFAEYAGIDMEKYNVILDSNMTITFDSYSESVAASAQKLAAYLAAGDLDVMVSAGRMFADYANSDCFYDLREILTPQQLEKYEPYFYYVDWTMVEKRNAMSSNLEDVSNLEYPDPSKPEEMERPVPVAIYVNSSKALADSYYFQDNEDGSLAIGVFGNTGRLETALKYIDYLLQ